MGYMGVNLAREDKDGHILPEYSRRLRWGAYLAPLCAHCYISSIQFFIALIIIYFLKATFSECLLDRVLDIDNAGPL